MYTNGKVCISILHPPGPDEMSGEDASERWLPTRSIATIILSVISILSAPNFSSPANIDASVEMRKNPEAFNKRVKVLVEKSLREKPADVKIPHPDTDPAERAVQIGLSLLMHSTKTPFPLLTTQCFCVLLCCMATEKMKRKNLVMSADDTGYDDYDFEGDDDDDDGFFVDEGDEDDE